MNILIRLHFKINACFQCKPYHKGNEMKANKMQRNGMATMQGFVLEKIQIFEFSQPPSLTSPHKYSPAVRVRWIFRVKGKKSLLCGFCIFKHLSRKQQLSAAVLHCEEAAALLLHEKRVRTVKNCFRFCVSCVFRDFFFHFLCFITLTLQGIVATCYFVILDCLKFTPNLKTIL